MRSSSFFRQFARLVLLCVGLIVFLHAANADAYKRIFTPAGASVKWATVPVGWVYNHNGFQQISSQQMLLILQSSFQKWESPACSALRFSYGGTTASGWNTNDGQNVLVWNANIPDPNFPNALALTIPTYNNTTGAYLDADIIFNGSYPWSTQPSSQQYDIEGTSTHEIGHLLGLDHSQTSGSTMFPTASPGVCSCRTLKQDDIDGVCTIYPSGSSSSSGTRQFGQACDAQNLCTTGLTCVLLQQGATAGICFRRCTNGVCPSGDTCYPLSNGEDACLCTSDKDCSQQGQTCDQYQCKQAGSGPTYTKQLGEACDAQNLCIKGQLTCVITQQGATAGTCFNTCPNDTCADGNKCYALNNGEKACLCLSDQDCGGKSCQGNTCQSGNPGGPAGKEGEACGPGGKCETGLTCLQDPNTPQSLCIRPCQSNSNCTNGWECHTQYQVCVPGAGTKQRGDACDSQNRCATGLLCTLAQEGATSGICILTCSNQTPCPTGESCAQVQTGQQLCLCNTQNPCPTGKTCKDFRCVDGSSGCRSNTDCPQGQQCAQGQCTPTSSGCQNNSQCAQGQICQNNLCIPDPSVCQTDANCPPQQTCVQGRCVPATGCQSDNQCAAGQRCINGSCVTHSNNNTSCSPACASGSVCYNGSCIFGKPCKTDLECEISESCQTGFCRPTNTNTNTNNPPKTTPGNDKACGCDNTTPLTSIPWFLLLLPLLVFWRRQP